MSPETSSHASSSAHGWTPPTVEHLQSVLPQYEIVSMIGRGGMGAVYKGRQPSLDRFVAIKILPPVGDAGGLQFVERFKSEARVMAKLVHPRIVAVFDFGEIGGSAEGRALAPASAAEADARRAEDSPPHQAPMLYFVMEHIDGADVAKLIASQTKLPPERALAIAAAVCDALAYAHAHGVIHRDIKPANVLIDAQGQVKVADFGLAKMDDPTQTTALTQAGMTMGTPDYVAPEALTARVPVDGRADLYAVGVMLYQMLTGEIPRGLFKMPGALTGGVIDRRIDAIITKAMQTNRNARYQTAEELRKNLDAIIATPRRAAATQRSTKTNRALIIAAAVACALVTSWLLFSGGKNSLHSTAPALLDGRWTDGLSDWWKLPQKGETEPLLAKETGGSRIISTSRKGIFLADGAKRADVSVRATVRGIATFYALHVRHRSPDNYQAVLFKDGSTKIMTSGPRGGEIIRGAPIPGFDPAASHVFEFTAKGDRLTVLVDGTQTCAASDRTLGGDGMFYFAGDAGTLIEKLEYR